MMEIDSRVRWEIIFFAAFIVGIAFQGSRGLYESSEGRYAECGYEMIASGKWLVPTLDSKPHFTKPPMTYWAIASGIKLLGKNEWGVRFYLFIAFVLTTLIVAATANRMWGHRAGNVAGIVYATSFFPAAAANMVTTDALLTLWEVAAAACYWQGYSSSLDGGRNEANSTVREKIPGWVWMIGMWLFFGIAFLTKGPPGILPLLAIIPFHIIQNRKGRKTPMLFNPAGILIFAIIGAGWYLAVNRYYPGLLSRLVRDELAKRVIEGKFHRNPEWYKPFVIYLPIMALGCFPWVLFWFSAIDKGIFPRKWRSVLSSITISPKRMFLVMWMVIPLILFSIFKSRLALYILPIMAPVAIATARAVALSLDAGLSMKKFYMTALAAAVLIISAKAGASYYPDGRSNMLDLYKSAQTVTAVKNCDVSLYHEDLLWGLQFYLGAHIDRIGSKKDLWADKTMKDKLQQMTDDPAKTYMFIAHPDRDKELSGKLDKQGLKYNKHSTKGGWIIFVLDSGYA